MVSAIVGLGMTDFTREYQLPSWQLAVHAIHSSIKDAKCNKNDIDGLLINKSPIVDLKDLPMELQDYAGLKKLRLLNVVEAEGSSMVQMIQQATMAINARLAKKVICVFSDTPLKKDLRSGDAFAVAMPLMGKLGVEIAYGFFGPVAAYALSAQRYLAKHNTTTDDFAAVAIANRRWAQINPLAKLRKPLTLNDYNASPWIVEPLRLLDCAYPVNGAVAVIVSEAKSAREYVNKPVYITGMGQGHLGTVNRRGYEPELNTGAKLAGEGAYKMAGLSAVDIDACQFYDAFSFCTLLHLEQYGFCQPGTAGKFVLENNTSPGGKLPVNTSGGHLSGYYLQGATPVLEAILQLREEAGDRQLRNFNNMLVTGYGGRMQFHAALIMTPEI